MYDYYWILYVLPHLQDQGKVFYMYSTIHKSCHCIYFLNSPCPFPRGKREKVSKDNTVKNRQEMTKDSHFCSPLIPKTIIIFISLNIQKEKQTPLLYTEQQIGHMRNAKVQS